MQIPSGRSKYFLWSGQALSLTGSLFDDGLLGTVVYGYAANGTIQAFRSGRNPNLNSLNLLSPWEGYRISAKSSINLSSSQALGFGIAPDNSVPSPTPSTNRYFSGINPGSVADYQNRLLRNAAKQAREFTPIGGTNVSASFTTLSATSGRATLTNVPAGTYKFAYLDGGIGSIAASHGVISGLLQNTISDWTYGILTTTANQSSLTLTVTGANAAVGVVGFEIQKTVPTDANGYSLIDCETILWDAKDKAGTYAISYTGAAVVTSALQGTISDLVYNSNTNRSTAKFTLSGGIGDRTICILRFTNVAAGGLSDLKIMCPIDIGSTISYDPNDSKVFEDKTLAKIAQFDGIRLMVTCGANANPTINVSERNHPEQFTQNTSRPGYGFEGKGLAWEFVGALCNETKAKNPDFKRVWVCVPVLASDAYIVDMILAIKNGKPSIGLPPLDPSIEVVAEFGNELWNNGFGFAHTIWSRKQALLEIVPGTDTDYNWDGNGQYYTLSMRRNAKRSMDIADSIKANLPGAYGNTWFVALQWQQANTNGTALSIFEYLDLKLNSRWQANKSGLIYGGSAYYNPQNDDPNLSLDSLFSSASMDLNNWKPSLQTDANIIIAYSPPTGKLRWDKYEGGTSFDFTSAGQNGMTQAQSDNLTAIKKQANLDPRITAAIVDHHNLHSQYGGGWIFYLTLDGVGDNNPWSFVDSVYAPANTPKMQAIDNLKASNSPQITYPTRTVPFTIAGNDWQMRSEGYGQGAATGDARIAPGSNYGYTFRITAAENYKLLLTANNPNFKVYLGSDLIVNGLTGNSPYSVDLPSGLQPGIYGIRIRNMHNADVFVNTISVQSR
jgi:hypothetical protein